MEKEHRSVLLGVHEGTREEDINIKKRNINDNVNK
jgi:hypothetical protein